MHIPLHNERGHGCFLPVRSYSLIEHAISYLLQCNLSSWHFVFKLAYKIWTIVIILKSHVFVTDIMTVRPIAKLFHSFWFSSIEKLIFYAELCGGHSDCRFGSKASGCHGRLWPYPTCQLWLSSHFISRQNPISNHLMYWSPQIWSPVTGDSCFLLLLVISACHIMNWYKKFHYYTKSLVLSLVIGCFSVSCSVIH